ncbi:hypothetical protein [Escherichia coli]|uniref:hypothetical protein n=1 Tax=Escherichia coli TaxID=562 RepID=UPI003CC839ED
MDSVHHIWCPLFSQEFQDLPDGAETTLTAVLEILQKKKQCVDGLMIMCAAIADTTTLKTYLESVVKTILSKLIKNAKATKKANLFIHI